MKRNNRRSRQWPQVERVVSTNFPEGFNQIEGRCYVPLEDFNKLKSKYLRLFGRYKRSLNK